MHMQIYQDQGNGEYGDNKWLHCHFQFVYIYNLFCMKQNCEGVTTTVQTVAVTMVEFSPMHSSLKVTGMSPSTGGKYGCNVIQATSWASYPLI